MATGNGKLQQKKKLTESTKTGMIDFYGCTYKKLLACIPSDWQKVLPSLDQRKQAFNYMCDNIDGNCLQQLAKGAPDGSTPDKYLAFVCSASQLSESCTKTAYSSCPKRTAEVVAEIEKYNRPAACYACVSRPSLLLLLVSVLTVILPLSK
ncbi:uncharacterized protein [Haliotis asinina]|uniref:uncharacterized protein n=1 Tax=Haliotis asinina TaxID=109174 RepID=UPI003532238C